MSVDARGQGRLFVGVDGGATKTRVVIGDQKGDLLAEGSAGATNFQVVGVERATANLSSALASALALAPAAGNSAFLGQVVVGIAGLDSPDDVPPIFSVVSHALAGCGISADWQVVNDAVIAWAGALGGEAGGIVISGSGAAALAVNGRGEVSRADGLGHWLGDEGSGFEIGRNGLRAALRALEGRGPQTALAAQLQSLAGGEIENWVTRLTVTEGLAHKTLTGFAPAVVEAGCQGDGVALGILVEAGAALAATASGVLRQAGLTERPLLATVGSLFAHAQPLRDVFCRAMTDRLPGCQVIWPRLQPAEGALLLARRPELLPSGVLAVANTDYFEGNTLESVSVG